jgi:hypothetical protein
MVTHVDFEDKYFSQRIETASSYIDSNFFHSRWMALLFPMFIPVVHLWQLMQSTITHHFTVDVQYSILTIQYGIFWPYLWCTKCIFHWFWCSRYKKLTLLMSASFSTCLISLWQSLLCTKIKIKIALMKLYPFMWVKNMIFEAPCIYKVKTRI